MTSRLSYGKDLVQSHFWVIFEISILNNSYNRLNHVFEQIISTATMRNLYLAIK